MLKDKEFLPSDGLPLGFLVIVWLLLVLGPEPL